MAQIFGGAVISVSVSGFSAATGGTSARSAIPNNSSGSGPNYIRVAARNECYVKVGDSTVTATANDVMVQPADSVIMHVPRGITHIAYIQGTTAGSVNVAPLDNS